jgi:hypothetical protein
MCYFCPLSPIVCANLALKRRGSFRGKLSFSRANLRVLVGKRWVERRGRNDCVPPSSFFSRQLRLILT